ncbi:MAG: CARDB domain-containing protein [Saprospiraceae bacterium]
MYRLSVIQKPFLPLVFFALVCIPSLLAQAPPNDDCSGAITLIPILSNNCTTPTNGTTVGATPSGVPNDCVFGNPNDDVWYKFTATDTEHTITLDCSVGFDGVMDIRSGSCNGPNIKCVDGGLEGVTEMVTLSNLSIGTMYFIRVYEYYTDVYGPFSICVTATPTVIERDLSVSQILLPQSGCANSALQSIRVRITNNGTLPQSGFTVQYTVNGAPVNETVFATVPAGGTIDYTFSQQANMPVSGNSYTIQARTLLPNDQNPANDATSATYSNMPAFDASVSGATSVCQGIGTYISAFGGSGVQYVWSNNLGTGSSVFVNPATSTQYQVTVTNSFGCVDVDTVAVNVQPLPSMPIISFSGSAPQFCQGGGSVTLTSNISTDIVWNTGETTQSIVVNQAGNYWVKHSNQYGCINASATVYVNSVPSPTIITQSVGGAVCPGGSDKISVNTSVGAYTYSWSSGETSSMISVSPAVTSTYTVTVTNVSLGCVYVLSKTIQVLSNTTPGPVSNMLPVNGAQNITSPVSLSWAPATNASHYKVYVWKQGNAEVLYSTTPQISVLYFPSEYGVTYNWRVVPESPCETGSSSGIQSFTSAPPSDLVTNSVGVPSGTVFSGTQATFTWEVDNIGAGAAGATHWYDVVYLSPDSSCATTNDDQSLGGRINPTSLQPADPPYTNSLSYKLPNGSEGKRFVLVRADAYNDAVESNENNNCRVSNTALMIELTPPPDLRVLCNQVVLPGVGNTVQAGQTYSMGWRVKNQGLGPTNAEGWYDRVFLSKDSLLSPATDALLGSFYRNGDLEVNQEYQVSLSVTIPGSLNGTFYLFILTDYTNQVYEHNFEFNNTCLSAALTAIPIPKPNFTASVTSVSPVTLSNGEQVTVKWQTSNQGAAFNGFLTDDIYLSTQPNLISGSALYLGSFSQKDSLETSDVIDRQKDVNIPAGNANGLRYIIVKADGNNAISEGDESDNALNAQAVTVQSPDLAVPANSISFPANMVSGQQINIKWDVRNNGPGKMLNGVLADQISLSLTPDGANPIKLGVKSDPTSIFVNDTYSRSANFQLSQTLSGTYYVVVNTNYNNNIYEAGMNSNNMTVSSQQVQIQLATFPDLQPLAPPQAPLAAQAGETILLSYQVANNGAANTQGNWQDRIYLSNSPSLSSPVLLTSVTRSQVLQAGQNYLEDNVSVTIPATLQAGQYYLFVTADAGNSVFEFNNENNNTSTGQLINISTTLDVDLAIQPTLVPSSVTPGVPTYIAWTVTNNGSTATPVGSWPDRLYLSSTPNWPPTGNLLTTFQHYGSLGAGQTYSSSGYFTVPAGQSGTFYLLLATDPDTTSADHVFSNNYVALAPSGGGGTIIITYPPEPDLEVVEVNAPAQVQAGQPLKVAYKVRNNGPGSFNASVLDAVYRSTDLLVNAGDIQLASKSRTINLATNDMYSDSLEISFPASDSGNVLILVKTNASNTQSETMLANNTNHTFIQIKQPPPADLIVENIVAQPTPIQTGNQLTVSWQVKNAGANPVTGYIQDGVYLSEDQVWDAGDLFIGSKSIYLTLTPGSSQDQELVVRLEGVENKSYWVIVRTDIFNNYPEINEHNNFELGGPVQVEIPELPISVLTPADLPKAKPIYYRIEVPTNLAGEMLSVEINSSDNVAFNELYLRYGKVPSRTAYDWTFDKPFSPYQRLIVPALQAGTYYVMAYAPEGADTQQVNLLAKIVPFALESVQANKGGNTGNVTVLLTGTKFDAGMQVWLENSLGGMVPASNFTLVNTLSGYVTFPLNGVAPGVYDVHAENSVQNTDVLTDGFEVTVGTVSNQVPTLTCSFGNGFMPLTLNALTPLAYEVQHPASARPNQVIAMTFRMENTGTVDIPVPQRLISSVGGAPLSLTTNDLGADLQEVQLEFAEDNAPPAILRPGGVSYRTVYTKAIRQMQFNVLD